MKLNHAKQIVQEPKYVKALQVIAEAEAKEAEADETVDETVDEKFDDENE